MCPQRYAVFFFVRRSNEGKRLFCIPGVLSSGLPECCGQQIEVTGLVLMGDAVLWLDFVAC